MNRNLVQLTFSLLCLLAVIPVGHAQTGCANTGAVEGVWGPYGGCFVGTDGVRKCIAYRTDDHTVVRNGRNEFVSQTSTHFAWVWVPCMSPDGGVTWTCNTGWTPTWGGTLDHLTDSPC